MVADNDARFLIPVILFGGIVSGRNLNIKNKRYFALILILGLVSLVTMCHYEQKFVMNEFKIKQFDSYTNVEKWLEKNKYIYGYSSFGVASKLTVESKNKIKVRPVRWDGKCIIPFKWLSDKNWYEDNNSSTLAYYLIVPDGYNGVNRLSALKAFSEPDRIKIIDKVTIFVWNRNITHDLSCNRASN